MSAIGVSVVSVFCFPLNNVKELISQNFRLEEQFYHEIFLLQIRLSDELSSRLSLSEEGWRIKKQTTWYRRIHKKGEEIVKDCYIVLIEGKVIIDQK